MSIGIANTSVLVDYDNFLPYGSRHTYQFTLTLFYSWHVRYSARGAQFRKSMPNRSSNESE